MSLSTAQGFDVNVKSSMSMKVLLVTSSLFCYLLITVFSARTTSVLNIRSEDASISTLQDVLDYNMRLFIAPGGHTESIFKTAKDGTIEKKIWDSLVT